MADIFTIFENRGNLNNLKVSYVGDGNNIVHSWLMLAQKIPFHFSVACPEGFEPDKDLVNKVKEIGISEVEIVNDPYQSVKDSDVVTQMYGHQWDKKKRQNKEENYFLNSK